MKFEWLPLKKFPQHANRFRNRGASYLRNIETHMDWSLYLRR
jgi:hypothetical protein